MRGGYVSNIESVNKVIAALSELLAKARAGEVDPEQYRGICHYIDSELTAEARCWWQDERNELMLRWEYHTGDPYYPIPITNDTRCLTFGFGEAESPEEQYEEFRKWEGKQLKYRIDLMQYLIALLTEGVTV